MPCSIIILTLIASITILHPLVTLGQYTPSYARLKPLFKQFQPQNFFNCRFILIINTFPKYNRIIKSLLIMLMCNYSSGDCHIVRHVW